MLRGEPAGGLVFGLGGAKRPALAVVAGEFAEDVGLGLGLDALGNHLHAQFVGEDGWWHRRWRAGGCRASISRMKGAVELDGVAGDRVKVAEGRVAGAEVVDEDLEALARSVPSWLMASSCG